MRRGRAFTLVEMLVVVAIIAILAALLAPSLRMALDSARNVACVNQLKGMQTAAISYSGDSNSFLPGWWGTGGAEWAFQMASYAGATVSLSTPAGRSVSEFRCPQGEGEFSLPNQNAGWWAGMLQITYGMSYLSSCAAQGQPANSVYDHFGKYSYLKITRPAQPSQFRLFADTLPGGTLSPSGTTYGFYYYIDKTDFTHTVDQQTNKLRMLAWRHFGGSIYVGEDWGARVNGSFLDGHVASANLEEFTTTNTTPANYKSLGYTEKGQ